MKQNAIASFAISLLFASLCGLGIVAALGASPTEAVAAFGRAIAGSSYRFGETWIAATPLLLCGLRAALGFRSGLFNIGAEGQLLAGMLAATALGVAGGSFVLVLIGGAVAGAVFAAIAAVLRAKRNVPEVLATLLLNFVALHLVSLALQTVLREPGGDLPQSAPLLAVAELPRLFAESRVHLGCLIAILAAFVLEGVLFRTAFGLRLRAAGESEPAARLAGFPVDRDRFLAFSLAGALAGLAGAIEVSGVTHRLFENPSPGFGYIAIAVALLGRNRPLLIAVAAYAFGVLECGCLGLAREIGLPRGLAQVLQAIAILGFLVLESRAVREFLTRRGSAAARGEA